ncbi:DUF6723 family protein [Paraburkholderia tropica]|uniref:DUF6723 family protein n=1 Tax=Paraburkholderia tropica TaxID=92647 RepID=UPI0012EA117A|nr:DUF6723 family protein [Paraburkholderia tropica]
MKHAKERLQIADGYEVTLKVGFVSGSRYRADVRITRSRDGRVIFPFDGCPRADAFDNHADAVKAARESAQHWINIDLSSPE